LGDDGYDGVGGIGGNLLNGEGRRGFVKDVEVVVCNDGGGYDYLINKKRIGGRGKKCEPCMAKCLGPLPGG
jgi:hypothetical protein